MHSLSVVIITYNEETSISACIESAKQVSDDIVVIDSCSSDHTVSICSSLGARCFSLDWHGFGFARNFGAAQAKYDWILALDADERITNDLAQTINTESLRNNTIYKFRRTNYLGHEKLRFGAWGFDMVKRIYNRQYATWDAAIVHEKLVAAKPPKFKRLKGTVVHYGFNDFNEYKIKTDKYARLCAKKYLLEGRKPGFLKKICSVVFNSSKSYFFQLGFLDGWKGLRLAYIIAYYSWLKYSYLQQFHAEASDKEFAKPNINVVSSRSFS